MWLNNMLMVISIEKEKTLFIDIYISLECSLNVNTNVNSNMYFEKFKVKDRHSLIIQSIL